MAVVLFALVHHPAEPCWPESGSAIASRTRSWAVELTGSRVAFAADIGDRREKGGDEASIRAQPLCVAASNWSSGTIGDAVLFVHERRGNQLLVGYFVYWSAERPWGDNALTYTVLPALAIDATYSHFMFVLPGVQRLLYGAGDIEGALVVYDVGDDGALIPHHALADDGVHQDVLLSRSDLLTDDGRVVLRTDVWSHQLGARGGASYVSVKNAQFRCYSGATLQPLSVEVARDFRLGSAARPLRARPAWRAAQSG